MNDTTQSPQLRLTRTLDAPRTAVWKAWTDPAALAQWWGPAGASIQVKTLELQPGGIFHYSMSLPDGTVMWAKFVYGAIEAPVTLEFINSFSDEAGGISRNPWIANWPLEVHNTLTLEEQAGKTVLTLTGEPINASDEEIQTFANGAAGMQQGFAGTFAQLDAYLKTA